MELKRRDAPEPVVHWLGKALVSYDPGGELPFRLTWDGGSIEITGGVLKVEARQNDFPRATSHGPRVTTKKGAMQ